MTRPYYLSLLLICFSLLNANNLRNLDDIPKVSFSSAGTLTYDLVNNKLSFDIILKSNTNVIDGTNYKLTIIYKGEKKVSDCTYSSSGFKLSCSYTPDIGFYGPIELAKTTETNTESTITLDLTSRRTLQQEVSIQFVKAYNLEFNENNYFWSFNIEIIKGQLPDNSFFQVDYISDRTPKSIANCTLSENILNCKMKGNSDQEFIKLNKNRESGSISWSNSNVVDVENILYNLIIESNTWIRGIGSEFIDNKWKYIIQYQIYFTNGYYYTMNTILKKTDDTEVKALTKCLIFKSYYHECIVQTDNQLETDFLYLTRENDGTSIVFQNENVLKQNIFIPRNVSLTLEKAYDLEFKSSKWQFKIDVAETSLRNDMKVTIDIGTKGTTSYDISCLFSGKTLDCLDEQSNQHDYDYFELVFQKKFGSVTWKGKDENSGRMKIPLKIELTYISSYLLIHNGTFWNFKLDATLPYVIPVDSLILIDIKSNDNNLLAMCQGNTQNAKNVKATFSCACELDNNSPLLINKNKIIGSVSWKNITGDSASISEKIILSFKRAYDMTYDINQKKWQFFIECDSTAKLIEEKKYILDYTQKERSDGNEYSTKIECELYSDKILICSRIIDSTSSKNYLLYMKYPTTTVAENAIYWSSEMADKSITLKTNLKFVKGTLSYDNSWFLNLNVEVPTNNVLPVNSKVIINIQKGEDSMDVDCNAQTSTLLKCNTKLKTDTNSLPALTLKKEKNTLTSITWTNTEGNEDYYYFYLNTELEYISADKLKFNSDSIWQFNLETSLFPEKTKVIIDILYDGESSTATCTIESKDTNVQKMFLLCLVDNASQSKSKLVKINHNKTQKSTITWNNLGSDSDIITVATLNVLSVKQLAYQNSKWSFKMNLQNCDLPLNSKFKIDLIYKDSASTGTCILKEENILTCEPDVNNQKNTDTFTINPTKTSGSITYSNSNNNLIIQSSKMLDFQKVYDLQLVNSNWNFKLLLSESNLRDEETISIDIELNGVNKKAECTNNENLLTCSINKENNYDRLKLINNESNQDLVWSNLDSAQELFVEYSIAYNNCYGGFDGNDWKFIMKYEKKDAIDLNGNYALLDISVDNNPSTAKCKITEQYLECESQHSPKTKDNIIKIEGNTILGTIHFSPNLLESQKSFKTIELSMTFSKIEGFKYENGKIEFKVKGNLKDNLEAEIDKNTLTQIKIVINKKNDEKNEMDALCETNAINNKNGEAILTCGVKAEMNKNEDEVEIVVDSEGKSIDVTFVSLTSNIAIPKNSQAPQDGGRTNKALMVKINYWLVIFLLFIFN